MALKKYDKNQDKQESSAHITEQQLINARIEKNKELEEQLKGLPLDEQEDILKKNVNDARLVYQGWIKHYKRWNLFYSLILIAILIVCFVLIFVYGSEIDWVAYVCFAVIVVDLVGMWGVTKWQRSKTGKKAQEYIDEYCRLTNIYIYSNENFHEKDYVPGSQLDDKLFFDAHLYQNLKGTKSRNVVFCKYKNKNFVGGDLAAFILVKNKTSPMFLGKFYQMDNYYKEDDKYILFQLKGGEFSRPIDDVERDDIKLVEGNDTYAIYSNDTNWRKILTRKAVDELKKFNIDSTLIDVLVSIRKGTTVIAIDYMDDFINVPIDSEYNPTDTRRAKQDLNHAIQVFNIINRNINPHDRNDEFESDEVEEIETTEETPLLETTTGGVVVDVETGVVVDNQEHNEALVDSERENVISNVSEETTGSSDKMANAEVIGGDYTSEEDKTDITASENEQVASEVTEDPGILEEANDTSSENVQDSTEEIVEPNEQTSMSKETASENTDNKTE